MASKNGNQQHLTKSANKRSGNSNSVSALTYQQTQFGDKRPIHRLDGLTRNEQLFANIRRKKRSR